MKNLRPIQAFFFGAAILVCSAATDSLQAQTVPLGSNPNPVIWGGKPTNSPPVRWSMPASCYGGYYPYYPGYYGHHRYSYGYLSPYPYSYSSGADLYLPPMTVPAGELFGPGVAKEFLGGNAPPRANPNANALLGDDSLEPQNWVERGTNARSLARAWKFIGYGDARFAKQEYVEAGGRYRSASQASPQLADTWFRQGFTAIAIGRYESAANLFKRGLNLNPDWVNSGFRLQELYGLDEAAKTAHRDALIEAAENSPNDANLHFVLGVILYYDGQAERAKPSFDRAIELSGGAAWHLRPFAAAYAVKE